MSVPTRAYRYATTEQWQSGLFHQAGSGAGLQPLRPFDRTPKRFPSPGGAAPTLLPTREILWRDDHRVLHLLSAGGDTVSFPAPPGIATSPRLIANSQGIWAI